MNNILSIERLGWLLRKDFTENWKRYGLRFIIMVGMITLFMITTFGPGQYQFNQELLWVVVWLFAGFGVAFGSFAMELMISKTNRISYLMLPASDLEKYVSRWLIVTIGYVIVFFLAFLIADWLRVLYESVSYPAFEIKSLDLRELAPFLDRNHRYGSHILSQNIYFVLLISVYFLLQSIFILGSLFWEKHPFLKTFAVVAFILTLLMLGFRWIAFVFYDDRLMNFLDTMDYYLDIEHSPGYSHSSCISWCIVIGVIVLFTLVNWVLSYFRFRESEVIERW